MTFIIEEGKRIDLDSLDTVIMEVTSTPKDVIRIIKNNPTLFEEWKKHEEECDTARKRGPIPARQEEQVREKSEDSIDELIPQKKEKIDFKYKNDSISSQSSDHGDSHYLGGSTEIGGCGCGAKIESVDGKMSLKKTSAETGQNKKYAEAASGDFSYQNNASDKFAYTSPDKKEEDFQYQR